MEPQYFTLPASGDGITLSLALTVPETEPKAVLQLVHGMSEHKGRYLPLMQFLSSRGYACVMSDLRGHGASAATPSDLGYFSKGGWKGTVADIAAVSAWCKERFPGLPLFLFGHSMGSMLVRAYSKEHDEDIAGLVVCGSPSANSAAGLGKILARIVWMFNGWRYRSRFLAQLATGNYGKRFKRKGGSAHAWICSDNAVVEAYDADPLCGFPFTVNGYYNLFALMQDIYDEKGWNVRHPDLPVLFIAGAEDPCIVSLKKFASAVSFFRGRGYSNVTSKVYPSMRHEIHNETGKQAVWDDLANTLDVWTAR